MRTLRRRILVPALAVLAGAASVQGQSMDAAIERIMARPEFTHSFFGIALVDLQTGKAVYRVNGAKFFMAASTTKLLTVGTALHYLGADYRFHTRVYRTGPIAADGTLEGDLVLVASGDANLSGRIRPDGTLAFMDDDHSYGGPPVAGDPLLVIRELAAQAAGKGIKRIRGRVLVDASLFPSGDREGGTQVVISPVVVNDNVIDIVVTPGAQPGAPATVAVSPFTSYLRLTAKVATGEPGSASTGDFTADAANPDGTRAVTLTGTVPAGGRPVYVPYAVPDPVRFAAIVFTEALHERGIVCAPAQANETPDFAALSAAYTDAALVAEHVSPPFSEDAKVTLKVSQNLHASMLPYVLSAVVAKKPAPQAGFDLEREWLLSGKLDVSGAAQGDGAGAHGHFSPDFMTSYLAFVAAQPWYPAFFAALPVLGKDGTLADSQVKSPAAGQVHAKTGTFDEDDLLNASDLVTAKALGGFFTRADGKRYAFAVFLNRVDVKGPGAVTRVAGQTVGEIAAALYSGK